MLYHKTLVKIKQNNYLWSAIFSDAALFHKEFRLAVDRFDPETSIAIIKNLSLGCGWKPVKH